SLRDLLEPGPHAAVVLLERAARAPRVVLVDDVERFAARGRERAARVDVRPVVVAHGHAVDAVRDRLDAVAVEAGLREHAVPCEVQQPLVALPRAARARVRRDAAHEVRRGAARAEEDAAVRVDAAEGLLDALERRVEARALEHAPPEVAPALVGVVAAVAEEEQGRGGVAPQQLEGVPLEEDVGAVRDEHARHRGRQRPQARRVPHVPQAVAPEAPVRAPQLHAAVGPRADLEDVQARVARGSPPQDRVHHLPRRRDDADEGVGVRHAEAAHRDLAAAPVARQRVAPRRDRGVREADDEERLVGRRAGEREEGCPRYRSHATSTAGERRPRAAQ
ncbi:unnamed protein product, partial [Pelagomonas calceolata]